MTNTPLPRRYSEVPGFNIDWDEAPAPSSPSLERFINNHELVSDLARFAEGQALCTESAIRKKWRLSEDVWELLGGSDELEHVLAE